MSVDQVVQASNGSATPATEDGKNSEDLVALARAPYSASNYEFVAWFMFGRSSHVLTGVHLDAKDPTVCPSLFGGLRSQYGQPLSESEGLMSSATWRDQEQVNFIAILEITGMCQIQYSKLKDSSSGL